MLKKIALVFGALAIIAALFVGYAGFFHCVRVEEKNAGPYVFVYQKATGPYKNAGAKITEVHDWLILNKIESDKCFGYYFDNPRTFKSENLRYIAGCIIADEKTAAAAKKKFLVGKLHEMPAMAARFPYKNKLNIFAGAMKVYPALARYAAKKNLSTSAGLEIYDAPGKTMDYFMITDPAFDAAKTFYDTQTRGPATKKK